MSNFNTIAASLVDRAVLEYGVRACLIFCLAREFDHKLNAIIVEKAIKYKSRGVLGIDLAGTEKDAMELKPDVVAGYEDLFDRAERAELAYLTDTLVSVIDHSPEVLGARTLILESTFLDDRKSRESARAGCHVHLDEIVERADAFAATPALALMHVSQLYQPGEVGPILDARLPPELRAKTHVFAPSGPWPG